MTATFKATPAQFGQLIEAVLPHAAADSYIPTICCINLEVTDGRLLAIATDRYTLGVCWAELADWDGEATDVPPIAASVFAADLRRLLSFLKPHRKTVTEWELTEIGLTARVAGESLTVRTVDVTFPAWRGLLSKVTARAQSGVPAMRFTPAKIGSFLQTAKALGQDAGQILWRFGSESSDAPIIQIGATFIGILMPQRMDELPALDLGALGVTVPAIERAA